MRAPRQQEDRVQIDLIDVDPEIFTDADADGTHARHRWHQVATSLAVLAVVAGAAVAWWPKPQQPQWRVFQTAPVPVAGLSQELVFDQPPGRLVTADVAPPPVDIKPGLGYVFGEPDGTVTTRRWATFRTLATNQEDAPLATDVSTGVSRDVAQVGGVAAEVSRARIRHEVSWGPVEGRNWVVTTNMLNAAQSLDFANQVGIVDGEPALAYQYQLAGMQPVGSVAALDCVELLTDLFRGERGQGAAQPTLVTWGTPNNYVSLGSIAAPSDALPLVEFVLGPGRAITVHGVAATVITSRVLAGPVIAWVEDGRLIIVAGDASAEELIALAESVRPATEGEWRRVGLADIRDTNDSTNDPITVGFGDGVTLYRDVNPMTDAPLAVTVQVVDDQVIACVEEQTGSGSGGTCETSDGKLPLLVTEAIDGRQFVVAIINRGRTEEAELRITLADGAIYSFLLEDISPQLPGPAVATLLPTDHSSVELWIGSEVVASL